MAIFDAKTQSEILKQQTKEIRKQRYRRSKLDRYKFELLSLKELGTSVAELQRFLRKEHRIIVHHSTLSRWVKKHG